jgi:hypothetical protein
MSRIVRPTKDGNGLVLSSPADLADHPIFLIVALGP